MEQVRCVVCGTPIAEGAAQYANLWESKTKEHPCCGSACARRYDPDEHWLPAVAPVLASDAEVERLVRIHRGRLSEGDSAIVVAKELLLAGVPTAAVRKLARDAVAAAAVTDGVVASGKVYSKIAGLLFGLRSPEFIRRSRTDVSARTFASVESTIDAWAERFDDS